MFKFLYEYFEELWNIVSLVFILFITNKDMFDYAIHTGNK